MNPQAVQLARTMALRAPSVVDDLIGQFGQVAQELRHGALWAALDHFEAASRRTERLLSFLVLARDLVRARDGALSAALDAGVRRVLGLLDQVALALEGKDLVAVAMLAGTALTAALEEVPALARRVEGALQDQFAAA